MNLIQLTTSLESSKDVIETLNWKLSAINEAGLPAQSGIADYISLALDNLDAQVKQLDYVMSEIKARKEVIKEQKAYIQEQSAQFILDMGIDKLEGAIYSSVTITKAKEPSTKEKRTFMLLCSKDEMEAFLVESGLAVYEVEQVEIPAEKAKIRVNKRKVLVGTIEDVD